MPTRIIILVWRQRILPKAAQIVTEVGCQMVIANGSKPALLYDIVNGKPVGTRFLAKEK